MDTVTVKRLFIAEAQKQGIQVRNELPDGRILVERGGHELSISLDNLERDILRDEDPSAVGRFVTTILNSMTPLPAWTEAKSRIRFTAESADQEFGDTLRIPVTTTVTLALAYVTPDESRIRWLSPEDLADWGIDRRTAEAAAKENMEVLLAETPIKIERVDRFRLGMFDSDSVFKASLVISPGFKKVIESKLGWQALAVIPCRDFAYFFSAQDDELISRLGSTVVREYTGSGYPITTEVLELSDKGVKAIGAFPIEGIR